MSVSSTFRQVSASYPRGWRGGTLLGLAALVSVGTITATAPELLVNTTPSEPPGLYLRSGRAPTPGRLVAFLAPAAAFPYADRRLSYLHQVPLLKAVAAGSGDLVCTLHAQLEIYGKARAPIVQADRQGVALPHWNACRRLTADELFVFSDRVPNSFDSRYFGPVRRSAVLGVYVPLVVERSGGR